MEDILRGIKHSFENPRYERKDDLIKPESEHTNFRKILVTISK